MRGAGARGRGDPGGAAGGARAGARAGWRFLGALWAALLAAWAVSGERFLDRAFTMPDLGPVDDHLLAALVAAEEAKAALGLPDLFGALRAAMHLWTGPG